MQTVRYFGDCRPAQDVPRPTPNRNGASAIWLLTRSNSWRPASKSSCEKTGRALRIGRDRASPERIDARCTNASPSSSPLASSHRAGEHPSILPPWLAVDVDIVRIVIAVCHQLQVLAGGQDLKALLKVERFMHRPSTRTPRGTTLLTSRARRQQRIARRDEVIIHSPSGMPSDVSFA